MDFYGKIQYSHSLSAYESYKGTGYTHGSPYGLYHAGMGRFQIETP